MTIIGSPSNVIPSQNIRPGSMQIVFITIIILITQRITIFLRSIGKLTFRHTLLGQ